MAKYQVLKRVPTQMRMADNQIHQGEMVEFVQIPDVGISQVQVYFVSSGKTDAEILGFSSAHHENELKTKGIGFQGPQGALKDVESKVQDPVTVNYSVDANGAIKLA